MRVSGSHTVVLASGNPGKLAEFERLLAPLDLEIRPQSDWDVPDAVEDGPDFLDNAMIKARHAAARSGLPAIADDSGLVVPVLGGEPGVMSARYAGEHGNDAANNRKLLEKMRSIEGTDRAAYFQCVMVLVTPNDTEAPLIASAQWWGEIGQQERGEGGFGYDPLFLVPGTNKTSAQLAAPEKNRLSHRGQATRTLLELMESRYGR